MEAYELTELANEHLSSLFERRLNRERQARLAAERILEEKSAEIFKINKEIEEKNEKLKQIHQELTDSIRYARRIQNAILPGENLLQSQLNKLFVLYKPKDIVSGDFYWMSRKNGKILFAAADSTGHGVPGALMSIIGHQGFNKAVNELGIEEPAEILNFMNVFVQSTLSQNNQAALSDGMDVAFCSLDYRNMVLEYAGAINPLYIVRGEELIEIKGDRKSIGAKYADFMMSPFTNHKIQLQPGDTIYVFSDGYADQFGGEKEKKFSYRKFKELLISIRHNSMQEQRDILEETIENWMGDVEQIDDMIVVGARIPDRHMR